MYIANTLLPIFIILLTGLILRKSGFLPDEMFKQTNRLVYWIALPCLLFIKITEISLQGSATVRLVTVLLAAVGTCIVVSYIIGWIVRVPVASLGAFVQGAFRGNLVYVGLPVIFFSLSSNGNKVPERIEALAIMAIVPMVIVYNIICIPILLQPQLKTSNSRISRQVGTLLGKLITNPLLIAVFVGLLVNLSGLPVPLFFKRTCSTIGQLALPVALLAVGASLRLTAFHKGLRNAIISSAIKVFITPAAGYIIGRYVGLTAIELKMAMLFLACPTASVSYVIAQQLKGDADLTCSIILISTMLSFLSFIIILLL